MTTDRIPVSQKLDPAFLKRIDSFRFEHWIPTRTAATMWLLEWALEQNPQPPAPKDRVAVGD